MDICLENGIILSDCLADRAEDMDYALRSCIRVFLSSSCANVSVIVILRASLYGVFGSFMFLTNGEVPCVWHLL